MINKAKQITIYDIAKTLNISAATVSRALTGNVDVKSDTREKILNAASNLGYSSNNFASNLRKKQSKMIGVIVPKLDSHFMAETLSGIEKSLNMAGYHMIICQSHESVIAEIKAAKAMLKNRVDGLLVSLCYDNNSTKHFDELISQGVPVVFYDRTLEKGDYDNVKIDNFKAAYDITTHLISQSCKRILHITASQRRDVYADRLAGYKQALKDSDIAFNEDYVLVTDLNPQYATEAAKYIVQMATPPDAVFAVNDFFAVTCMKELQKMNIRVPEDIAFAGFNNDPIGNLVTPSLTTVNYDGVKMGQLAARTLLNKLTEKISTKSNIVMAYDLVIRDSSVKHP
jgi:LacI family transcriptional regulator